MKQLSHLNISLIVEFLNHLIYRANIRTLDKAKNMISDKWWAFDTSGLICLVNWYEHLGHNWWLGSLSLVPINSLPHNIHFFITSFKTIPFYSPLANYSDISAVLSKPLSFSCDVTLDNSFWFLWSFSRSDIVSGFNFSEESFLLSLFVTSGL